MLPDFPDVRVGYLVEYREEAGVLIEKLGRNARAGYKAKSCPENMKRADGSRLLPVIGANGGACAVCKYCVDNLASRDVVFVRSSKKFKSQGSLFEEETPVQITRKPKDVVNIAAGVLATADFVQGSIF